MKKKRKPGNEFPLNEATGYAKLGYPPDEDIFIRNEKYLFIEEASGADVVDTTINMDDNRNEKPLTGEDLDVPGSELDDASEEIGSEDEENNYYSLGGDNHRDLEDNNV